MWYVSASKLYLIEEDGWANFSWTSPHSDFRLERKKGTYLGLSKIRLRHTGQPAQLKIPLQSWSSLVLVRSSVSWSLKLWSAGILLAWLLQRLSSAEKRNFFYSLFPDDRTCKQGQVSSVIGNDLSIRRHLMTLTTDQSSRDNRQTQTRDTLFFMCSARSKQCFFLLYRLFRFNVLQNNRGYVSMWVFLRMRKVRYKVLTNFVNKAPKVSLW